VHSENKFWKYLIGSVIIIITSFIGQLPWLLGITYVTNIKVSIILLALMNDAFDPVTLFLLISLFYHGRDLLRGALLAQSDDSLRDYSKAKNR
jgi:hypothetical protein